MSDEPRPESSPPPAAGGEPAFAPSPAGEGSAPTAAGAPGPGSLAWRLERVTARIKKGARAEKPMQLFFGVTLLVVLGLTVLVFLYKGSGGDSSPQPKETPLPARIDYQALIRGRVRELGGGRVEICYDFPKAVGPDRDEECLEARDWQNHETRGDPQVWRVGEHNYLAGPVNSRIRFDGDVAVECEFCVLRSAEYPSSHQITPLIALAGEHCYSLGVSGGGKAALFEVQGSVETPLGPEVASPKFVYDEPHLARFELAGRKLTGSLDGQVIVTAELPAKAPTVGTVALHCNGSAALFGRVRIVGKPHADWLRERLQRYAGLHKKPAVHRGPPPAPPEPKEKEQPGRPKKEGK